MDGGSKRSGFTEEIAFPNAKEPERLGRYELLAPLGKGGMASVFLARLRGPVGFEKLVALKRIHPSLSEDPRFVDMFLDEARVAAALQHPNIAHVFELGNDGSVYFLAMEYLHGEHLGAVLARATSRGERLPVELACWIVARVAEGLHHAHEATDTLGRPLNVIHRDVSPQNIFVTYAGNVKLTDFGVAKASSNQVETDAGTVKGKFAYMAPEQALGEELDRRADVFALGTVLWEALTGRRLFRARTDAETLLNVTRGVIPSLLALRPEAGEDVDAIVRCALAVDRQGRFESAGALARALSRQCGDVSAEEVRAWMQERFRGEEAQKRALVSEAAQIDDATVIEASGVSGVVPAGTSDAAAPAAARPDEASEAATRAVPREEPAAEPPAPESPPPPPAFTRPGSDVAVAEPIPGERRAGLAIAIALLAIAAVGGLGAYVAFGDLPSAPVADADPERPAGSEPETAAEPSLPNGADPPHAEEPTTAIAPPEAAAREPAPTSVDRAAEEREPVAPRPRTVPPRRTGRSAPPPVPSAPPPGPPGTVQVSIDPGYPGARYGWVRFDDGPQRPLPAVLQGVSAGEHTLRYRIGEDPEQRARVRVASGETTTVRVPR